MSLIGMIVAASVLIFAAIVQSIIGFAFNLLALPLLIWSGLSLAQAIALSSVPILVQVSIATYKLRYKVPWSEVILASMIRFVSLPVGVSLLYLINDYDPTTVKQFVGAVLLLILTIQSLIHIPPRAKLGLGWDILAFGLSGLMLGMLAMGGPPVVLWLMAHDWSAIKSRAFMAALFFIAAPVQLGLLYWKLVDEVAEFFLYGALMTPLVIASSLAGIHLGNRLNRKRLRRFIIFFLFLTGLASLLSPWLHFSN